MMSSATTLQIKERGRLEPGYFADVVVSQAEGRPLPRRSPPQKVFLVRREST